MTTDERQVLAKGRITWRGDLSDDCSADWAGLLLRAEWMCKLPPKVSQSKIERSSNFSLLLFLTVYEKEPLQRSPDSGYFAPTGPRPDRGPDLPGTRHQ